MMTPHLRLLLANSRRRTTPTRRATLTQHHRHFSSTQTNQCNKWTPLQTFMYTVAGSTVISLISLYKYIEDQVGADNIGRAMQFYSLGIPRFLQYKLLQWRNAPQDDWDALDRVVSAEGLAKTKELRGFYIKSGQMAAANIGNAFPKIWQDTFSVLQDACPHRSFDDVRSIIERDFNQKLEDVFESFDEVPIGAASIGQVHRAILKKNKEEVVVKVQYPDVEGLFRGDVRTLIMFCEVAQPVHVPALIEIENQFMTEFDYRLEAEQLQKVRSNMIQAGFMNSDTTVTIKNKARKSRSINDIDYSNTCIVPKPYMEYCSKNVLVMEELKGKKIAIALQRDVERHAARAGITLEKFKEEEERKDREAWEKGIERMGPSTLEFDQYIVLANAKRKLENAKAALTNCTLGLVLPRYRQSLQDISTLPLNHARLVDELLHIHGHQILVDGYFNGDPHPGNILLVEESGRKPILGLIDYGQVKKLPEFERLLLCKLIIALADNDKDEIINLMQESGFRSKYGNKDVMYKYCKVSFDQDNKQLTEGKYIQVFMDDLNSLDPVEALNKHFIMPSRVSIILRGLAHALHQHRSVAHAWKPIALDVLKRNEFQKIPEIK